MESKSLNLAFIRTIAGTCGGFTLGALSGYFESVGTESILSFGMFCAIAGLITGAIGHILFIKPGPTSAVRSILNYAVIGAVFFVSISLVTPESLAELMGVRGSLQSMTGGLIGGAMGGAIFVILVGGYSGAQ